MLGILAAKLLLVVDTVIHTVRAVTPAHTVDIQHCTAHLFVGVGNFGRLSALKQQIEDHGCDQCDKQQDTNQRKTGSDNTNRHLSKQNNREEKIYHRSQEFFHAHAQVFRSIVVDHRVFHNAAAVAAHLGVLQLVVIQREGFAVECRRLIIFEDRKLRIRCALQHRADHAHSQIAQQRHKDQCINYFCGSPLGESGDDLRRHPKGKIGGEICKELVEKVYGEILRIERMIELQGFCGNAVLTHGSHPPYSTCSARRTYRHTDRSAPSVHRDCHSR